MGEEDKQLSEDEERWKSAAKIPVATEKTYTYDPKKMMEKVLPLEKNSEMYSGMQEIYPGEDPMDIVDHKMYKRGGLQQSRTKREFTEWGRKIALERGIPSYNRELGIPLGQRTMETMPMQGMMASIGDIGDTLTGEKKEKEEICYATYDDVNFFNNAAMHQMLDDIKRTVIINLDVPHRTIQLRLGKEISPETMNLFMETIQHRLAGGAVIQEHMAELHPGLTSDGFGKVFTGDDDLADQFDRRFIVNINKEFCPGKAEMIKVGVGSKLCCAMHEPTLRVRMMDGGAIVRSAAQSATMAFVSTYRLTGESVLSDIAYSTRHAQQIRMGEILWQNRSRAPNEPGGMTFGYLADMCPADSFSEPIPTMELISTGDMDQAIGLFGGIAAGGPMWTELLTNCWYGQYMAGGVGFNAAAYSFLGSAGFVNIEGITSGSSGEGDMTSAMGMMGSILKGHERMPAKWRAMKPFVHMIGTMVMDQYDKYPTFMEFHWGGAIRTFVVSYAGAAIPAFLTGDALLSQMAANYCVGLIMKEGWFRTGWAGQETQHHIGMGYSTSLRPEEGGLPELKGPNVPYMSYTVGALGMPMFCYGAMIARGSAWSASPLIKVTFADPDMAFNFRDPLSDFTKAVLREYEPAGERDIIRPAR